MAHGLRYRDSLNTLSHIVFSQSATEQCLKGLADDVCQRGFSGNGSGLSAGDDSSPKASNMATVT